ncbi:hypothetical protein GUJ93_ZPchr0013g34908 [Zizania palustris]|uniref:Secreted protein n=1 Tax=Zizania palustris TaxID=103762 RepID=A0A8J5WUS7_ZIZPA|nr:hypothetical protein GUJ93_ZPchr0013g34908 [Zizania palustris]
MPTVVAYLSGAVVWPLTSLLCLHLSGSFALNAASYLEDYVVKCESGSAHGGNIVGAVGPDSRLHTDTGLCPFVVAGVGERWAKFTTTGGRSTWPSSRWSSRLIDGRSTPCLLRQREKACGFDHHIKLCRHITRHIVLLTQLRPTRQVRGPPYLFVRSPDDISFPKSSARKAEGGVA